MSNDEFILGAGQAHELEMAFRRNNWTNADVHKLAEKDRLSSVLQVLRGYAQIAVVRHVIDCDADPFVPDGWSVESHQKGGQFEYAPGSVRLHLDPGQQNGQWIRGTDLRSRLTSEPVLNANVLDYWLAHPEIIPEECKGKATFFWGTIYRRGDELFVRCLYHDGAQWYWNYNWLDHKWDDRSPAAIRASS